MRRKLILRFLLAYMLITLCIQTLVGGILFIFRGLGAAPHGASLNMQVLQHLLINLGRRLADLLLPGTDMSAVVGVLVSAGILLAGAVLFARGPVRDYRNLCEKARRLSGENAVLEGLKELEELQLEEAGEPDMERVLDAVATGVASVEEALQAHRADCQAAALLLDAAYTQIEVLVEADSFAEGSGEASLVQDALAKIKKAKTKIV